MPVDRVNLYEGLFLLSQASSMDLAAGVEHVKGILEREGCEILVLRKWDERKLAYPIRGQKRGTYLLAYFKGPAGRIANIERDCNLSELVQRALIIKADHVGEVELEIAKKQENLSLEVKLRTDERAARGEGEVLVQAAVPGEVIGAMEEEA
jgi:small subunit ribosomal protein S6